MKKHWRNLTDEKYLGSWDLEEEGKFLTVTVTIEKIFSDEMVGQMGKQIKPFIKFKEFQKNMVCNKTNFKRLEKRFNSFKIEDYLNKQIYLTVEKADSPQGKVDALRILSKEVKSAPEAKKTLSEGHFERALKAIEAGNMTTEKLKNDFQLNSSQLETLKTK